MTHVLAILLILALHLPGQATNALTCTVRYTNAGKAICWCKANRPGSRWQVYPMVICQLVN